MFHGSGDDGAGDLFASGFLHGYLEGKPLQTCAHYGALLGAAIVQIEGAILPQHYWKKLNLTVAPSSLLF